VRLVRLGDPVSKVADDLKATLTTWGTGDAVLGGVALLGYQPLDHPRRIDAVIVVPRAMVVVVGVDLPDPALKLVAPLSGQWRIDGWPLVSPNGAVNPAADALAAAAAMARHLRSAGGEAVSGVEPVTVIAVGPYVGAVTQPDEEREQARVLHPEPMTLLTAVREVSRREQPFSLAQARYLLRLLCPDGVPEDLADEGFTATDPLVATPAKRPRPSRPARQPKVKQPKGARPARQAKAARPAARRPSRRSVGIAALATTLVVVGVLSVALANRSDRDVQPTTATVDGTNYTRTNVTHDGTACAAHSYGDVQVWLGSHPCADLRRWTYAAEVGGRSAAVAVAEVDFADRDVAVGFQRLAAQPGTGGISDLVREGHHWPGGPSSFDNAMFDSSLAGSTVRLVEAVWTGTATARGGDDLAALAKRTLGLPLTG